MRGIRIACRILAGKPEGMRQLGRPRDEGRITLEWILEKLWDVDWIHLAQVRVHWRALMNMVMNLRVPYKAGNFLTS
jgi:hypothetical protein